MKFEKVINNKTYITNECINVSTIINILEDLKIEIENNSYENNGHIIVRTRVVLDELDKILCDL